MLINVCIAFLGLSLLFYCVFAGADFGGGIIESFLGKTKGEEQKEIIAHAIAPVWEANHIWLILAVVILFNGFPAAYAELTTIFHIPLLILLMGIILRGCAFTFRSYDAIQGKSRLYYSAVFIFSSYLTPLMFGILAGALCLGATPPEGASFADTYLWPWLNWFSVAVGLFTCTLFSFLASVFLIGETEDVELKKIFSRRARLLNVTAIVMGAIVFLGAEASGFHLIHRFVQRGLTLACVGLATVSLVPLWIYLRKEFVWRPRLLASAQMCFILLGWFSAQFPVILTRGNLSLSFYNSAAPEATLRYLLFALAGGSALIFPSLIYLLRIFKNKRASRHAA